MTKQPGLTPAQRSAFFRALSAASIELGLDTAEDRETYRKTVMREETGKEHLAQLSRTKDFDACMRRFAADAGDFETASRFAISDDARKAAILRICCAQVLQLKGCVAGTTEAADYLAGIVEQARVPCGRDIHDSSFWMDCAPGSLMTLFRSSTPTGGDSCAAFSILAPLGRSSSSIPASSTSLCRTAVCESNTSLAHTALSRLCGSMSGESRDGQGLLPVMPMAQSRLSGREGAIPMRAPHLLRSAGAVCLRRRPQVQSR